MSASSNSKGFGVSPRWPLYEGIIANSRPNVARVYYVICAHANSQTWQCYPSLDLFVRLTGIERSKLHSYIRYLTSAGAIRIVQRGGGRMQGGNGMATVYKVVSDEERTGAKSAQVSQQSGENTGVEMAPVRRSAAGSFFSKEQVPNSPDEKAPPIEETEKNNNNNRGAEQEQEAPKGALEEQKGGKPPSAAPQQPSGQGGQGSKTSTDALEAFLASQGVVGRKTREIAHLLAEAGIPLLAVKQEAKEHKEGGGRAGGLILRLENLAKAKKATPAPTAKPAAPEDPTRALWRVFDKAVPAAIRAADAVVCADAFHGPNPPPWSEVRPAGTPFAILRGAAATHPDYLAAIVAELSRPKKGKP